jgi:CBF1 interacting corepressor
MFYRQYIADSDESAKLSLNFMYEAPPGMKKENKGEEEEEQPKLELKFDWQKQIPEGKQAPRESYAKDLDIKDKPFGIEVRNVHCIKCGKWGHINTDKICPLFGKSKEDLFVPTEDPTLLMREMRKDGLAIKRNAMGRQVDPHANNQVIQYDFYIYT